MTRAKRVDLRVMDDALVCGSRDAAVSVRATGVGPRFDVAKACRGFDQAIAVSIHTLVVLDQTDMDNAVAGAVRGPDASIQVDRRAGRIFWLSTGRRGIFAEDLPCFSVDLDDRSF